MSQENIESIKLAIEAFNRRDADAFVALASPDVEWEDGIFWSGVSRIYRGRDELRDWFEQVVEPWASIHLDAEEFIEASDGRLLVGLRLTARGEGSGADTRMHAWQVNWFTDGKTGRRQVFRERAEALEAAGLSRS
jgi:ketosteroid isomerase-like protein